MLETNRIAGPLDEAASRYVDALERALGPEICAALRDEQILEVMLNPDGSLWLDHRTQGLVAAAATDSFSNDQAASLIRAVAGLRGLVVHSDSPLLECELPLDGSRFTAIVPPVVSAPSFALRKRASLVYGLERYVGDGILDSAAASVLSAALAESSRSLPIAAASAPSRRMDRSKTEPPKNVVISGGPGSGKTTLANALLREISRGSGRVDRLLLIEDTYELRCEAPCHVILHTTESVDLRRLVRVAMRYRPDRIVVGEVRGAEALDLLKAWNTGTPGGVATVHANGAEDALERLDHLAQEAGVPSQRALVASSVDLVVHIERCGTSRRVRELVAVDGLDGSGRYRVRPLRTSPLAVVEVGG